MNTALELVDKGVIFRNPLPGHRVINAFYPDTLVLPGGEWICVLRVGGALYSPDGMLEIFRSPDQGKTWQRQGPVRDRKRDSKPYNYCEGYLTPMRDGSIVLRMLRWDVSDPERFAFNAKTSGLLPFELSFMRSTDQGRTWSEPVISEVHSHFPGQEPAGYGRVIELADGTWFHCFETWKTYDDAGPFDLNPYGLFSKDGGRTWGGKVQIATGKERNRSYSHGQPITLRDGRLLIAYWAAEAQLQKYFDLHIVTSTDGSAKKWTEPRPTGIPGQSNCPIELSPGRMLVIYTHRENTDQPGIKVVSSRDGGQTFDLSNPLVVWDAYGKESLGVARSSTYPSSHDAIAYGAPKITRLDDHHAIAGFWCTQGADTHCRWCLIRMP